MLTEAEFDRAADAELHALEVALSEIDPDDLDVELSQGVLTLTFADDQKCIVNSHRAAGQIWMAAFRTAWHFSPQQVGERLEWRTDKDGTGGKDELRTTLARVIGGRLKRAVAL